MVVIYIVSFLVILIMANYYRQKKKTVEIRTELRKIREAKEKHLKLEKNVLCEDGVTRVYHNKMYGIIKEEIISVCGYPKGDKSSMMNSAQLTLQLKEGFCVVTGDILSKLTLHFNIHSIQIRVFGEDESNLNKQNVWFTKSKWFSEDGTILSQEEIINSAEYYNRKRYEGVKISRSGGGFIFNEINGHYFMSAPKKLWHFNGIINNIEFINGEPRGEVVNISKVIENKIKILGTRNFIQDEKPK